MPLSLTPAQVANVQLFAQVDNQGTAMGETTLCAHHHQMSAHRQRFETDHDYLGGPAKDGARVELIDTTWHDCTGNDVLSCNVCSATNESPQLIGKTIVSVDYGGAWGDAPATRLYFDDDTYVTFVHPDKEN